MRARWLALGLLLGSATLAVGQSGVGLWQTPVCSAITSPVAGATWCLQQNPPWSLLVYDGAVFSAATLSGPYAPTTYAAGTILQGNGTGPILATTTPSTGSLTTNLQAAIVLGPYGVAGGNTGEFRLLELAANGTEYVAWKAPDAITTSIVFKMPATTGTNGQCFVTDGATPVATISFGACSGGGSGITSLNALVGAVQTFTNDTNVQISSGGSAHAIVWASTLSVARGGSGAGTFTANGALLGNGTGAFQVTAAGAADTVLRVPGGGGPPAFGAVDLSKAAAVTGILQPANLGSGTPDATTFLRGDKTYAAPPSSSLSSYNYLYNSNFEVWGGGDAVVPTRWAQISGGGTGTGKEAVSFVYGAYSVAVTRSGGTDGVIGQDISTFNLPLTSWKSRAVSAGCWVRAGAAGRANISIADGIGTSTSTNNTLTNTFEWLTISRTISSGSITKVEVRLNSISVNATSLFDGCVFIQGSSAPSDWTESGWRGRKAIITLAANINLVTTYYGFVPNATESAVQQAMPFKGVLRNFYVHNAAAVSTGATDTVRKNAASQSPTVTWNDGGLDKNDTTHEVEFAKGDLYAVVSTANDSNRHTAVVEYEEIP